MYETKQFKPVEENTMLLYYSPLCFHCEKPLDAMLHKDPPGTTWYPVVVPASLAVGETEKLPGKGYTGQVLSDSSSPSGGFPCLRAAGKRLGAITAVNLIKHTLEKLPNLLLSLNNLEFTRCLLRERTPRNREIKQALEHLWGLLRNFPGWEAKLEHRKRSRLEGSPQARFPRGIFPYLKVNMVQEVDGIIVHLLPNSPDIAAQFAASIWRAKQLEGGNYWVPVAAKPVVAAWLASVTSR